MNDVTRDPSRCRARRTPTAAEQLLPLAYVGRVEEAGRPAAGLPGRSPGMTLPGSEYLPWCMRPISAWSASSGPPAGNGRGHSSPLRLRPCAAFSSSRLAASEARKHGGGLLHQDLNLDDLAGARDLHPLEGYWLFTRLLDQLAEKPPRKAELVKLRYFLGGTMAEAAQVLGIAQATAEEDWTDSKAWLPAVVPGRAKKRAPG